jgi:type I restriction enzyme R subunit
MDTPAIDFDTNEVLQSQLPAIVLLQKLGWTYLPAKEATSQRGGRTVSVLLDGILREQLARINQITYKGRQRAFSTGSIARAIQKIKDISLVSGTVAAAQDAYDLLTLGESFEETIDGATKSFSLHCIDWKEPRNNVFYVTPEFAVSRAGSRDTHRPDLVLFVNGIPLAVIECKARGIAVNEAIRDILDYQKRDGIPELFKTVQLVAALNGQQALYGTTGTPLDLWARWRSDDDAEADLAGVVSRPLTRAQSEAVFTDFGRWRERYEALEPERRTVTDQDRLLYELLRPEQLLIMIRRYIVFDGKDKKIARYQQVRAVEKAMARLRHVDADGRRTGGVVAHTQGSGKSLTMVMLAKAIAQEPTIVNERIVIVTDRVDLDKQIRKTFRNTGAEVVRATSGNDLREKLEERKSRVITTVINKFAAAINHPNPIRDDSGNIFVLVDEGHRSQYGPMKAKVDLAFPRACYVAFTGTPLLKREKNTFTKFGGSIDVYSIRTATEDGSVVPILYDGRLVEQEVNKDPLDIWFDRYARGFTDAEKADLKRRWSRMDVLPQIDRFVQVVAWDIYEDYWRNWKDTPFKAMLVAPRKETAIQYRDVLNGFTATETRVGKKVSDDEPEQPIRCEVLISSPVEREGDDDIDESSNARVLKFWAEKMAEHGTEETYNESVIEAFRDSGTIDILIVVNKLLTGFDAPRARVLYLAKRMKEHSLLQAIARVNRRFENKDYGIVVDYASNLGSLDEALTKYTALEGFDTEDVDGAVVDYSRVFNELRQARANLIGLFHGLWDATHDSEALERFLAPEDLRYEFYDRLRLFSKALHLAQTSPRFFEDFDRDQVQDLLSELARFTKLRAQVSLRYQDRVNFKEIEPQIRRLLNQYVDAKDVQKLTPENFSMLDDLRRQEVLAELGEPAAQADIIASATKRRIEVELAESDPVLFRRFSAMLEEVIAKFRDGTLRALEYLKRVRDVAQQVDQRGAADVPSGLRARDTAQAYYRVLREWAGGLGFEDRDAVARLALDMDAAIDRERSVDWVRKSDVKNRMYQSIDDAFYLFCKEHDLPKNWSDIERASRTMVDTIAAARRA